MYTTQMVQTCPPNQESDQQKTGQKMSEKSDVGILGIQMVTVLRNANLNEI